MQEDGLSQTVERDIVHEECEGSRRRFEGDDQARWAHDAGEGHRKRPDMCSYVDDLVTRSQERKEHRQLISCVSAEKLELTGNVVTFDCPERTMDAFDGDVAQCAAPTPRVAVIGEWSGRRG